MPERRGLFAAGRSAIKLGIARAGMADMAENWVRVAAAGDVGEGQVIGVRVGERDIALYHLAEGEYRATDNICTHEYAQLSEGWLEGHIIECPLHAGQFDVRSGKGLCAPIDRDLEIFEVRLAGGDIEVKLPA